ncbi:SCO4225 family membrane protein [Streptomyces sulphureus]|uniref:SCO4225 family membrane protein n=1 Tax=Streptomyces sulphureus TaxID=47758 RepID=UPI00036BF2DF|nr:hypothetical protein [Streptomyces sulphureus]
MTDTGNRRRTAAWWRMWANPAGLAYLALVAAAALFAAVDAVWVPHADASFAGVWVLFATAPASLLVLGLDGPWFVTGLALAALAQAALLGGAYRWLVTTRHARRTADGT